MIGHQIRIGQRGWNLDHAAETLDDVVCGVGCDWIEIDGHRFAGGVMRVRIDIADDEFAAPTLTMQILGTAEIVYLDKDGAPLGRVPVENTPTLEHGSIMDRT